MNTKQLLIFASFLSLMGMNACTNGLEDIDVLDLKSDPFILRENTLSLDNLSDETERQMTNSMLRLKSKKMLDISKSSLSANFSYYIPGLYVDLYGTTNSYPITYYQGLINSVHFQVTSYSEPYP